MYSSVVSLFQKSGCYYNCTEGTWLCINACGLGLGWKIRQVWWSCEPIVVLYVEELQENVKINTQNIISVLILRNFEHCRIYKYQSSSRLSGRVAQGPWEDVGYVQRASGQSPTGGHISTFTLTQRSRSWKAVRQRWGEKIYMASTCKHIPVFVHIKTNKKFCPVSISDIYKHY